MTKHFNIIKKFYKDRQVNTWVIFLLCIYIISVIKLITIQEIDNSILFGAYSITVSLYILSRFALAFFYKPDPICFDKNYLPSISFAVPSKNEGENIRETILRISKTDYPKDKFDVIAVNDGSDDNTLQEMLEAKKIALRGGGKSKGYRLESQQRKTRRNG